MAATGIELVITYKCNWFCDYCLNDTHHQPERSFQEVLEDANNIPPNTEVTISGGETGLMSRKRLQEIIDVLEAKNCQLDLLTNGLFIKKHEPLLKHFTEVWYHCLEYLNDDKEIEYPDLDQNKFVYIIVATESDLDSNTLVNTIERYPHIKFLVLPENRSGRRINFNKFKKFVDQYRDRIHPRTYEEWINDLLRQNNNREGHNVNGRVDVSRIMNGYTGKRT